VAKGVDDEGARAGHGVLLLCSGGKDRSHSDRSRGFTLEWLGPTVQNHKHIIASRHSIAKTGSSHCSSLSKTLSPGLRVGWVVSHRHREALTHQKFLLNTASPAVTQLAAASLLESGRYERHLRVMRTELGRSVSRMHSLLDRHFPADIRVTRPEGGFVLWLELPPAIDSTELAQAALEEGISVAPGALFSTTGKYHHHLRISCARRWSERVERALIRLGELIKNRL
jgi:DNA-binding transcriptional MocR family regulator